jgi:hypothetical protein
MRPSDGRVGEQHAAYRKGLVLGLTMAEVGILIIFVLLLLIGYQQTRYNQLMARMAGMQPIPDAAPPQAEPAIDPAQFAEALQAKSTLTEVAKALGLPVTRPSDDFRRLARVVQEASANRQTRQELSQANRALEEIRGAAQQMQKLVKGKDGKDLAEQAKDQSFRIANQEGQLKRYERQLADAGQGKGERPCWVEPDGTIDYLYDVVLGSLGIRMRERFYPARTEERNDLPMPPVDPEEEMTEGEFLRRTEALYRYSQTLNCRFFVVVYDATGELEKPLYKSELRTVEGHFYKLLSNAPPSF